MTNSAKVRWGILGAARILERMLPTIAEDQNSELIAVASRRPDAAAGPIARYAPGQAGIRVCPGYEELLDDPDVDAIYLPLANHEHAEWTLRAVERGKHVLCEKPMALRVADITDIEAAAKAHGVLVMEGFMYRFHPQHERVLEIIRSGVIGEVRQVRASCGFMMRPERLYRLANGVGMGGGAMWDVGCYAVHSARLVMGGDRPETVIATARYNDNGADLATTAVLNFSSNRQAIIEAGFESARRSEYEVTGTRGGLRCHRVWLLPNEVPEISWWTDDGKSCLERLPAANHFKLEVEHFSDCLLAGKQPLLTPADAKANCHTINAVLQSAAEGRIVALE
ncbi:MAG TPA: Gfo/Idh/MocA family oxidoreductase [Blastocatellia bacterium]|nr:Gfo/Idh/MocA family oxidoreductase [Blastocatellia bacterium]